MVFPQNRVKRAFPRLSFLAFICLALAVLAFFQTQAWAAGRQFLRGHVPKAARGAQSLGPVEDSQSLDLVLGLPLRNPQKLQQFLRNLYDLHSPYYRRFLTPDEFTEQFGPTVKTTRPSWLSPVPWV